MILMTIYNVLISKISNQDDIVILSPAGNRQHTDLENMIGMFVNTLAIRNTVKKDFSFIELLENVKLKMVSCIDNQFYQFEDLIEELEIERMANQNPLSGVSFTYQNFEEKEFEIPGLQLSPYDNDGQTTKFDLTLFGSESDGKIFLNFEYATDLFYRSTVERFIGYFNTITNLVIQNPEIKIEDVQILSKEEESKIIDAIHSNKTNISSEEENSNNIFRNFKNNPEKNAIVYNESSITYQDLENKTSRIARLLDANEVKKKTVGVLFDKGIDMIVTILGIVRSGNSFIVLDPDFPEKRITWMVKDSKVPFLFFSEKYAKRVKPLQWEVDHLKTVACLNHSDINPYSQSQKPWDKSKHQLNRSDLNNYEDAYSDKAFDDKDLISVCYASNSEGIISRIPIDHKGMLNYLGWASKMYVNSNDNIALFGSLSSELNLSSLFLSIFTGSCLHLYDNVSENFSIEQIIKEGKVSLLRLTSSELKNIEANPDLDLSNIRSFIVGGGTLNASLAAAIQERGNASLSIFNEYGFLETTTGCMVHEYSPEIEYKNDKVLIGKPATNNEAYVLNEKKQVLPFGVIGDLYIGGEQLGQKNQGKGIKNRAPHLINHPFKEQELLLKTGCLARCLSNGNIELVEEEKGVVYIDCNKIYLKEIEQQLTNLDKVEEVVVLLNENEVKRHLVCYYTSSESLESSYLNDYLLKILPKYMIPQSFNRLESFPLTKEGLLDEESLHSSIIELEENENISFSELESKMAKIWGEILKVKVEKISRDDNFFDLGGHSLMIVFMINKISEIFDVTMSVSHTFDAPVLKDFCEKLELLIWAKEDTNSKIKDEEVETHDF